MNIVARARIGLNFRFVVGHEPINNVTEITDTVMDGGFPDLFSKSGPSPIFPKRAVDDHSHARWVATRTTR